MSWIRIGDTFHDAPEFMHLTEIAADRGDDRLVGEIKGYTLDLYSWAAVNFTEYTVTYGAILQRIGASRAADAIEVLVQIGILTDISTPQQRAWKLLERESFIHLITGDEKTMRAKRRKDKNNGKLIVPVLLRDGSSCRYCGVEVLWSANNSLEHGTFDHRDPTAVTTVDNLVVCCADCNRTRADFEDPDAELPLLDIPEVRIYDDALKKKLEKWPGIVARTARAMGIPNPLTGKVETAGPDDSAASRSTTASEPMNMNPRPDSAGSQPAGDPRSATDSPSASSANGAAGSDTAAASLPASKADTESPKPSRAPAGTQPHGEPRPTRDASASAAPGGNGQRPRRRRRRRSKK